MHLILNEMKDIYSKAKICPFNNRRLTSYCELTLEPGMYLNGIIFSIIINNCFTQINNLKLHYK